MLFKRNRKDEISRLVKAISDLLSEVNLKNNPEFSGIFAKEIDSACRDLVILEKELRWPIQMMSITVPCESPLLKSYVNDSLSLSYIQTDIMPLTCSILGNLASLKESSRPIFEIVEDVVWQEVQPRAKPYRYLANFDNVYF